MFAAMPANEFNQKRFPPFSPVTHSATRHLDSMTPLQEIIQQRKLTALFQPILNLKTACDGRRGLIDDDRKDGRCDDGGAANTGLRPESRGTCRFNGLDDIR